MNIRYNALYAIIFFTAGCTLYSTNDNTSEVIERVKSRSRMYSAADYRPNINWSSLCSGQIGRSSLTQETRQEIYAMALGYKSVAMPQVAEQFMRILQRNDDVQHLFNVNNTKYALLNSQKNSQNSAMYLVYTQNGVYNALIWMKYWLLEQMDPSFDVNASRKNAYILWYLSGRVLGYPEEDIVLFCQRDSFSTDKGIMPEVGEKSLQSFKDYIHNEWPHQSQDILQSARDYIAYFKSYNNDIEQLKSDIQEYAKKANMTCHFDCELDELVA